MKYLAQISVLLIGLSPFPVQASEPNMGEAFEACFYFFGIQTKSDVKWEPAAPGWQPNPSSGELKIDLTKGESRVAVYVKPGNNRCVVTDGQVAQSQAIGLLERRLDYYDQSGWNFEYDGGNKQWKVVVQNTHLFDIKLDAFHGDTGSSLTFISRR